MSYVRPGPRVFGHFCWDLEGVAAAEGVQRPAANPGPRVFRRFCWDLDEEGATEGVQWPGVSPGPRVFRQLCWDLDSQTAVYLFQRTARKPAGDLGRNPFLLPVRQLGI